ncbi:MAG: hypothetical protein ACRDH8_12895 [Actinomycetota bacterium]
MPVSLLELPLTGEEIRAFIALSARADEVSRRVEGPVPVVQAALLVSRWRAQGLVARLLEYDLVRDLGQADPDEPASYLVAPYPPEQERWLDERRDTPE